MKTLRLTALALLLMLMLAACDDTGGNITAPTTVPQQAVTSAPVTETDRDETSTPALDDAPVSGTATLQSDAPLSATVTPALDDGGPLASPTPDDSVMPLGNN